MGKLIVPEEEKSYKFEMPDRTVKYPIPDNSKTLEDLKKDWLMINEAITQTEHTLLTVNWKLLIVDPTLTVTFIEAKTGLMASLKRLKKVINAIEKEISTHERLKGK